MLNVFFPHGYFCLFSLFRSATATPSVRPGVTLQRSLTRSARGSPGGVAIEPLTAAARSVQQAAEVKPEGFLATADSVAIFRREHKQQQLLGSVLSCPDDTRGEGESEHRVSAAELSFGC